MVYNLTNFTGSNNLFELSVASNDLTGGLFFVLVVALIFVISFVSMKRFPAGSAFVSASFITFVLSTVLWVVGLVPVYVLVVVFVLLLLSVSAKLFLE